MDEKREEIDTSAPEHTPEQGVSAGVEGAEPSPPSASPAISVKVTPLQVFDFTEAEEAVVNSLLEHGSQSVSKLGRTADLPRTTVFSVLKRLHDERGLVRRHSKGYASVWGLVSPTKIKNRLKKGLEYFDRNATAEQLGAALGIETAETEDFFTIRGIMPMLQVYQWMMINHFSQSVHAIQSQIALEALFTKLDANKLAQFSHIIKDNRVSIDTILPRSAEAYYRTLFTEKMDAAACIEERATSAYLVADSLLPFNADVIIGRNTATLADWNKEELILIKNPEMIAMLRSLFEMLKMSGVLFDYNALVREIIEAKD